MASWGYFLCFAVIVNVAAATTDRPIIGIVAQHYYGRGDSDGNLTHIPASYVNFVESAGARVVPVFVNRDDAYYTRLFNSVNGILFPGGSVDLETSGYGRAGKVLYDLAVKANDNKTHFPLWGTCLGFELLTVLTSGTRMLTACSASDLALNLNFTTDFRRSRMYDGLPRELERAARVRNITYNSHRWCLTPENFTRFGLDKFYRVLSTNTDRSGINFISGIEAFRYPFYGVQFHPEKSNFVWFLDKSHQNIPHELPAVMLSQYLANFFVQEARKNDHHFETPEEEAKALIYNYPVTLDLAQEYIFNE